MNRIKAFFSPEEFTGKHMAAVMVLFFGTIITVNFFMAFQANNSWTGLVVKNSYVASQKFPEVTAEKEAQIALGWQAGITYENGTFEISLTDKAGNPVTNVQAIAALGRPAHENDDHTVTLSETAKGKFVGSTNLAPGIWQADITASGATGTVWTRSVRFTVKG